MRALVLSGGGAKGAFQAGVLAYLFEKHDYEIITGVSVGALNAAYLCQFPRDKNREATEGLMTMWFGLKPKDVLRPWYHNLLWKLPALWKPAINDSRPLHKFIRRHLDLEKIKASGRILRVGATSLDGGVYSTWSEKDDDLVEGVLASSAFPAFMLPVKSRGQWWIDGGVRDVTPLYDAIKLGATEIDVIMCDTGNPKPLTGKRHALGIAAVAIDTALCEVELWDLKVAELYNALVAAKVPGYEDKRQVTVRVIKPPHLLLKDSLDFDPHKIRTNYMIGLRTAADAIR